MHAVKTPDVPAGFLKEAARLWPSQCNARGPLSPALDGSHSLEAADAHGQARGIVVIRTRRIDGTQVRLVPGLAVVGELPGVLRAADIVAVVEVEFVPDLGLGIELGLDLDIELCLVERKR